ncbi:MAG: thiol-disulfide oxidoreductase DCC family protein [Actinomycetota bacterium]
MSAATLLYDQDCGFCRWSVNKILRWDRGGRLRALPLQSSEAGRLLHDLEPSARMGSAHLVSPNGHIYSAGALVDPLFRSLRGGKPIAAVARSMPSTTERVYRLVARNRTRLGRVLGADACRVDPSRVDPASPTDA